MYRFATSAFPLIALVLGSLSGCVIVLPPSSAAPSSSSGPTIPIETAEATPAPKATDLQDLVASSEQTPASLSARGDVLHTVSAAQESLRVIVLWYTYDVSNLAAVARINQLQPEKRLAEGAVVTIPRYLVRNSIALPWNRVELLRGLHKE